MILPNPEIISYMMFNNQNEEQTIGCVPSASGFVTVQGEGIAVQNEDPIPLWDRMTHPSENITFLQLFWPVEIIASKTKSNNSSY